MPRFNPDILRKRVGRWEITVEVPPALMNDQAAFNTLIYKTARKLSRGPGYSSDVYAEVVHPKVLGDPTFRVRVYRRPRNTTPASSARH